MTPVDLAARIFLPLLTQETAVMVSTFTYGTRAGLSIPVLIAANTAAVLTDLALFFLPAYLLASRLHAHFEARYTGSYARITRLVERIGVFQAATALAFVMPSVAAMLCMGVLRIAFWPAFAGLLFGSTVYVVIPLVVALPLAAALPSFAVPALQWVGPVLAVGFVAYSLLRSRTRSSVRPQGTEPEEPVG